MMIKKINGIKTKTMTPLKLNSLLCFCLVILVGAIIAQGKGILGLINKASATSLITHDRVVNKFDPVSFSPDGNVIAVIGENGALKLKNVISGLVLWEHFDSINDNVIGLAFSPDNKVLASVGKNAVNLWNVESGQEFKSFPLKNNSDSVIKLIFSPDGKLIAGISQQNNVLIFSLTSDFSKTIQTSQDAIVEQLIFSPDGKFIICPNNGSQPAINLWDSATGELVNTLSVGSNITDIAMSSDIDALATAEKNGYVTLWNPSSGVVKRVLKNFEHISSLAFSPDGKSLAISSGGIEPKVEIWNHASGELIFSQPAEEGVVIMDLFYSPDGTFLAGIGEDNRISLWKVLLGEVHQLLSGQTESIAKASFNLKQQTLAAFGMDDQLIVWDLINGMVKLTAKIPTLFSANLTGTQTPVNTFIDTNSQLTTVKNLLTDTAPITNSSRLITNKIKYKKGTRRSAQKWKGIRSFAISLDGMEVGAAGDDGTIRVFKKNGNQRFKVSSHHGNVVAGIAFRGKTKEWVSVGRDTEIKTWDATGKNLQTFYGPEHPPKTVSVSPDGRYIATAGEDTRVFLYDVVEGKLVKIFTGHIDFVNCLAFSPNGQVLASAGAEGRVLLWDVATGKILHSLSGHVDEVNAVAFNPDSGLLASASEDNTVIIWNLATGQQFMKLTGHEASVRTVAFSPNGKKLVSAGEDSKILVWNPATGQLIKQLTENSIAINKLEFSQDGNLHFSKENSEVSEINTDTGALEGTIVIPAQVPLAPQISRSAPFNEATKSNSNILASAWRADKPKLEAVESNNLALGRVFNWVLDWVIPVANAALPDPNQGPGGPILVITSGNSTFGSYYTEILRTEGMNEFSITDISNLNSETLSLYDVVILAQMSLTGTQATMLSNWVNNGGNLIAMRPDQQLFGLLGLTAVNSRLNNGYLKINTSTSPGNGIYDQTMQYHGPADLYTLNSGTTSVADLYSNASTATTNPAVTLTSIGNAGGQAAAFAFDLATSIVYMRQGNPAWATQERDGFTPIRSDDKFFGQASGDPQVDWIDFDKISIPQGDEQQRLLVNLILEMNRDRKTLPRFWYFPRDLKAVVIMTGDDHANNGTEGRFNSFIAASPAGCSVQNWECVRGTSYMFPSTPLTPAKAENFNNQGFEIGLHINTNCADFTPASLEGFYFDQIGTWTAKYNTIPAPVTQRHHCIAWSDWVTGAKVQLNHGIRFDTSFYFWPPSWVLDRPGFFSGSGMPMRFSDIDGTIIDVYNATSQMTDESGQTYPFTIDTLLDRALNSTGFYGAFTINAHTDVPSIVESETTVASAKARGVPIITGRQMMDWLDYRNSSSFSGIAWVGNTLSFTVNPGIGSANVPGNGLQVLLPMQAVTGRLTNLAMNGSAVDFSPVTIKGLDYAKFSGVAGNFTATYGSSVIPLAVTSVSPVAGATGINLSSTISSVFSRVMDSATINPSTFELRDQNNNLVPALVNYNSVTSTASLTTASPFAASTSYTATLKGGLSGVRDLSGNVLGANVIWSFTTGAQPGSSSGCDAWPSNSTPQILSVSDTDPVDLGVKFSSAVNGIVTGLRFYQASAGTTFQATLWTLSGQQIATGSVTSTAPGWQMLNFKAPIAISANTVYVASYHAPNGNYAVSSFGFANCINNQYIHFLKDGEVGLNGLYKYADSTAFPTDSFQSSNYWVDVIFSPDVGSTVTTQPVTLNNIVANNVTKGTVSTVKTPYIGITAIDPVASESPGNPGRFMVSLNAPSKRNLLVKFEVTGKAKKGRDYQSFSNTLQIPSGTVSGIIEVMPIDDFKKENKERVTLRLRREGISGYKVRSPSIATVTILDND
jgi:WD40 repeat protein